MRNEQSVQQPADTYRWHVGVRLLDRVARKRLAMVLPKPPGNLGDGGSPDHRPPSDGAARSGWLSRITLIITFVGMAGAVVAMAISYVKG